MFVLKPVFALTKNINILLQKKYCGLSLCIRHTSDTYDERNEMRTSMEGKFQTIFDRTRKIAEKVDTELKVQRRATKQTCDNC